MCICGCKQSSDGWTSSNKQLDEFIKKSQLQKNSANQAYLEWIPFDWITIKDGKCKLLDGLPIPHGHVAAVTLTPLEITDETEDSYYYGKVTISANIICLSIV